MKIHIGIATIIILFVVIISELRNLRLREQNNEMIGVIYQAALLTDGLKDASVTRNDVSFKTYIDEMSLVNEYLWANSNRFRENRIKRLFEENNKND